MTKKTPPENKGRMIHIRLTEGLHKKLRVRVAEEDVTIQDWVERLIDKALSTSVGRGTRK